MPGQSVTIRATEGGELDCYLATPAGGHQAPAVVLACSIDGVDADLRQIADKFAAAHLAGKGGCDLGGYLEREAGLADTAGTGQADERDILAQKEGANGLDVVLATDERTA